MNPDNYIRKMKLLSAWRQELKPYTTCYCMRGLLVEQVHYFGKVEQGQWKGYANVQLYDGKIFEGAMFLADMRQLFPLGGIGGEEFWY